MLIFLDFDGVLHTKKELPFERLDRFERFVLERPGVDVVISSSWRETWDWALLLDLFSEPFQERLLGATPVFRETHREFVDDARTVLSEPGIRQREIEAYVTSHHKGRPWVALDDLPKLFLGTDRLLHVPNGLDETVLAELDRRIQSEQAPRTSAA